jgi:hypothetical protein
MGLHAVAYLSDESVGSKLKPSSSKHPGDYYWVSDINCNWLDITTLQYTYIFHMVASKHDAHGRDGGEHYIHRLTRSNVYLTGKSPNPDTTE